MSKRSFMNDGPTDVALRSWGFIGICLWVVIGAGIAAIGLGRVIGGLIEPLASFLIAGLIVVLARPGVKWLRKHGWGRGWSAAAGAIGALVVMILLTLFFMLPVLKGASQLAANAPQAQAQITQQINALTGKFGALPSSVQSNLQNIATSLGSQVSTLMQGLTAFFIGSIQSVFTIGLSLFMGLILTLWFLLDGEKISKAMLSVVPSRWRTDVREVVLAFDRSFSGYLIGTAINITVIFVACGIAFSIMKLPGAWFLAALIAILDLIPFVGPIIGGAVAVLVGFTVSPTIALVVAVVVLVVEQFVDSFLSPIVMGKVVTLHPVGVIFALTLGIAIAGFFGAILAIPVAAAVRTVYRYYKDKYSDDSDVVDATDLAPEET